MSVAPRLWCEVTVLAPCGRELATWTVSGPGAPGMETVDGLLRLRAAANRAGAAFLVRRLAADLAELLELAGLTGELERQPEDRE